MNVTWLPTRTRPAGFSTPTRSQSFSSTSASPGGPALALLAELSLGTPDVATVMVTGHDSPATADTALELGAYGYVTKPFGTNSLRIDLANALHRRRLELERRAYEENLEMTVALRTEELRRAYRETVNRLG